MNVKNYLFLQVQASESQKFGTQEETAKKEKISRDGNSFFNAISRALSNTTLNPTPPYQLREKLVQHLMDFQYLYYSRSDTPTTEKYQELVGNYLLDGHFSLEIGHLLPEAMAKILEIRLHIVSTNSEQVMSYGPLQAQNIQLLHDGSYYDYTPPTATPLGKNDAREYTPIRSIPPIQTPTQQPVGIRRLLFPNDR